MTTPIEQLVELSATAREGIEFYDYAAQRIGPVSLKVVFHCMARVRQDLVEALSTELVPQRGGSVKDDSLYARIRLIYQEMRDELEGAPTAQLVAVLIKHEAILLEALRQNFETVSDDGPHRVAEMLRVHLLRLHVCQEELQRLQRRLF